LDLLAVAAKPKQQYFDLFKAPDFSGAFFILKFDTAPAASYNELVPNDHEGCAMRPMGILIQA
jgi:hypothetical protein